ERLSSKIARQSACRVNTQNPRGLRCTGFDSRNSAYKEKGSRLKRGSNGSKRSCPLAAATSRASLTDSANAGDRKRPPGRRCVPLCELTSVMGAPPGSCALLTYSHPLRLRLEPRSAEQGTSRTSGIGGIRRLPEPP